MIELYSYPELFGLADNNPFGLKVWAFLKLTGVPFVHRHIFDASGAPRGQLPYIVDGGRTIGDSDAIIAHLVATRGLAIDSDLTPAQRDLDHLIRRTLDDLYWVMSYSRWKDERFWPLFSRALLDAHPNELTAEALEDARAYNAKRYHYQGIGRYDPDQAYARGLADVGAMANLLGDQPFLFGQTPHSTDAGAYGFLANSWLYPIDTPLKAFIGSSGNLAAHCERLHRLVMAAA
jgi:glutathione S-transferase